MYSATPYTGLRPSTSRVVPVWKYSHVLLNGVYCLHSHSQDDLFLISNFLPINYSVAYSVYIKNVVYFWCFQVEALGDGIEMSLGDYNAPDPMEEFTPTMAENFDQTCLFGLR